MKRSNGTITKLFGLVLCVVFAFAGLTACSNEGSSENVAQPPSSGGGNPPVGNPPTGGGGGVTPPVAGAALVIPVTFCTNIDHPPREINVKPSLGWWRDRDGKGSYDSFIVQKDLNQPENGWTCYSVTMARDQTDWVSEGNLFIAIFYGNDEGDYPDFANTGMKKNKVSIGGRDNPCVIVGEQYQGKFQAIVERAPRLMHIFIETHPDGSFSWSERWLPCNDGDQCGISCKDDMPDDGYQG